MKSRCLGPIAFAIAFSLAGCADEEASPAAGEVGAASETTSSEFAAFDTNTDGMLSEREWDSNDARNQVALKNLSFAQADQDANGAIDPREFDKARADDDQADVTMSSSPSMERDSEPVPARPR